jgi:hypothetical protein
VLLSDGAPSPSILLNNKTTQLDYGLVTHSNTAVLTHNFLEEDERFDSYLSFSLPKEEVRSRASAKFPFFYIIFLETKVTNVHEIFANILLLFMLF